MSIGQVQIAADLRAAKACTGRPHQRSGRHISHRQTANAHRLSQLRRSQLDFSRLEFSVGISVPCGLGRFAEYHRT
jgi:hypothetical protein